MNPFKTPCLPEADPPRLGRRDEAEIPYKENAPLENRVHLNALKFARKAIRDGVSKVDRKRSRADDRPIVELYPVRLTPRAIQPSSLQFSD